MIIEYEIEKKKYRVSVETEEGTNDSPIRRIARFGSLLLLSAAARILMLRIVLINNK